MARGTFSLLVSVGLLLTAVGFAASQPIQFGHTWGGPTNEGALEIEAAPDGSIYIAGITRMEGGPTFVAKFDAQGRLAWNRLMPSPYVVDMALDGSGNIYVLALVGASATLVKMSPTGDVLYSRAIGGLQSPTRVAVDPSTGSALVVGDRNQYGDGFLTALDNSGNVVWAKEVGGGNFASPWGVTVDTSGNWYLIFDRSSGTDVGVTKTDRQGNFVRQRILNTSTADYSWDIVLAPDGYIYALGAAYAAGDLLLAKFDTSLDDLWSEYVGSPNLGEEAVRLAAPADGSIYAVGGPILYRFNSTGGVLQASFFSSTPISGLLLNDMKALPGGGIALAGESWGSPPREPTAITDYVVRGVGGAWLDTQVPWVAQGPMVTDLSLNISNPEVPVDDFSLGASRQAWFGAIGTPTPALTVNGSYQAAPDGTVNFTAAVANGTPPYTYRWSFGDGSFNDTAAPSHHYAGGGIFPAQVFVQDAAGSTGYAILDVNVTGPPAILSLYYSPVPTYTNRTTEMFAYAVDTDGGSIVNYHWDFGDGRSDDTYYGYVEHVYLLPGNYTMTLTVTDTEGSTASRSMVVEVFNYVNQLPYACFGYSPYNPTAGGPVSFYANCSYDPDGYLVAFNWNFGDGYFGSGAFVYHVYAAPGLYPVTLNVTDNDGATAYQTIYLNVSQNQPPVANFTFYPTNPTVNTTVYFSANAYDPDGYVAYYSWDFGDSTGNYSSYYSYAYHIYARGGYFNVTLTVTDNLGAQTRVSHLVHVDIPPVARILTGAPTGKVGTPLAFDGSSSYDPDGVVVRYHWDFGDGTTAEGVRVNHTYVEARQYYVGLAVADDSNATAWTSLTVAVFTPKPPVAVASYEPSRAVVGEAVAFDGTLSVDPDGSLRTYLWRFGDGAVATGPNPIHAYDHAGSYQVELTVIDEDGLAADDMVAITVVSTPVANFTFSPLHPTLGGAVTFYAYGSYDEEGIREYQWDLGDGTYATGWQVDHTYTQAGDYMVKLTVVNAHGVTASTQQSLSIAGRNHVPGRVIASNTQALEGAKISVTAAGLVVATVTTARDGTFDLAVAAGDYLVEVTKEGFSPVRFPWSWTGDGPDLGTIILQPLRSANGIPPQLSPTVLGGIALGATVTIAAAVALRRRMGPGGGGGRARAPDGQGRRGDP